MSDDDAETLKEEGEVLSGGDEPQQHSDKKLPTRTRTSPSSKRRKIIMKPDPKLDPKLAPTRKNSTTTTTMTTAAAAAPTQTVQSDNKTIYLIDQSAYHEIKSIIKFRRDTQQQQDDDAQTQEEEDDETIELLVHLARL